MDLSQGIYSGGMKAAPWPWHTGRHPVRRGTRGDKVYALPSRSVDVQVMPNGALLVSDDKAGAIYRISYAGR